MGCKSRPRRCSRGWIRSIGDTGSRGTRRERCVTLIVVISNPTDYTLQPIGILILTPVHNHLHSDHKHDDSVPHPEHPEHPSHSSKHPEHAPCVAYQIKNAVSFPDAPKGKVGVDGFVSQPADRTALGIVACLFEKSPSAVLRALMDLRRKGQGFLLTHIGQMLYGNEVGSDEF